MNELQIFENEEFGLIRTTIIDGEPWLVGKDVAERLGYKDTADAIKRHVDNEDKGVGVLPTPGGTQEMTVINESGVYSLIFSSKLPKAKEFKRWVTSEVLPTIRKTGSYNRLSTDDYMKAANLIVKTKKFQLPHVLNMLNKAGFPVENTETFEVIEQNDSVRDFVKDCENGSYTFEGETTNRVYALYNQFCDIHNYKPICHGEFSKQIKTYGYNIVDKKINNVKCRIFQMV